MTKTLALCFLGLYAHSGFSIKIDQPADTFINELEIDTIPELQTDEAAAPKTVATNEAVAPMLVAVDEEITLPSNSMTDTLKEVVANDDEAAPELVAHEEEVSVPPASLMMVATDEASKERLAIARVHERSNQESKYAAIASAQAAAENTRSLVAAQLKQLHELEAVERKKRETILKQTIDAALSRRSDFYFLKRKPADNVTAEESQAIERVQQRTREEIEHKTIAAALATAENARAAAVAELEKMHKRENEMRKKTGATLKDALKSAMANQG